MEIIAADGIHIGTVDGVEVIHLSAAGHSTVLPEEKQSRRLSVFKQ